MKKNNFIKALIIIIVIFATLTYIVMGYKENAKVCAGYFKDKNACTWYFQKTQECLCDGELIVLTPEMVREYNERIDFTNRINQGMSNDVNLTDLIKVVNNEA